MTEIRWHARAGQGAKTAAQLLAEALLRTGKSVQAFPDYGPERRGAPVRAYTRVSDRPIRRHDTVTEPDVVVVLEPSLAHDPDVVEGLRPDGVLLVNDDEAEELTDAWTVRVPATGLAASLGSRFANLVMAGAVAAELGEPPLADIQEAAVGLLGSKADADDVRAAVEKGYRWLAR
ncbi:MAG TPA: 2-oxoacid:acceptor oxidoreductase family protein [Gaiellaceae bacterium]|nr:2-oxoacid:acceptor oxidoreductase family protein [Gaiellaceae bacterium]